MPVLTASWDASDLDMRQIERAAAFFSMDLKTFLDAALQAGARRAVDMTITADEGLGSQEVIDDSDDIPF